MAVGYLSVGQCWSTTTQAIDAFYSSFQFSPASNTTVFYQKVSGVWKVYTFNVSTGTAGNQFNAPTNIYGDCTMPDTGYNYTDAAAMWAFAFTWTIALWYLSKNLGQIINAVKRW